MAKTFCFSVLCCLAAIVSLNTANGKYSLIFQFILNSNSPKYISLSLSKYEAHNIMLWISASCIDTDGEKTDTYGDGCSWYDGYVEDCGYYDDSDFTATSLCCACGGGKPGTLTLF